MENRKKSILATNLIALRKSEGLSQEGFGKIAGVTKKTVYEWENDRRMPQPNNLDAIAKHFKMSHDDIRQDSAPVNAKVIKEVREIKEQIKALTSADLLAENQRLKSELAKLKSHPIWEAYEKATRSRQKSVREILNILDTSDPLNSLEEPGASKSRQKNRKTQ